MNILFLTSTLPRYDNDSQAPFVLEQALAWKKYRPDDSIYVLAPHDANAKRREDINDIHICRFRYFWPEKFQGLAYPAIYPNLLKKPWLILQLPFFLLFEFLASQRLCQDKNIDYIFAHWIMPQGLTAYWISKRLKIPYGLKNYSSDLKVFKKIFFLGPFLARKIIKNSQRLICENSLLKEEALNYFDPNEQPELDSKIAALSMGVFHFPIEDNLENKANNNYTFGFIGRLSKKKGVNHFINALIELNSQAVPFKAAIAGDGEERAELQKSCSLSNVQFLGFVSGADKVKFLNETKCLVYPSIAVKGDVEGMPIALLEALYLGKMIVASKDTNIELLPEWNEINDLIILLDDPSDLNNFAQSLKALLSLKEEEVHSRMQKMRRVTDRFLWKNRIKEYIDLLVGGRV